MKDPAPSSIPELDDDRLVTPNFITDIIDEDLSEGRVQQVVTRFPPEPNGYLHIGHAKAICLDFGVAADYAGRTNLRFDDTNPTTEDPEYVEAIKRDIAWLGFEWSEEHYASDYFADLYAMAVRLIEMGDAYIDSQSEEEIRIHRGTVTEPGTASPFRDRSISENLDLFERMRQGEFAEGAHVLRAKIDMANPNMILRDPVLYRIRHAHHYRTGDTWHIYPLYDFAHPLSDAIEGITHSLCTLEFVNNRDIYDWLVERLFPEPRPHQYEFSRLALDHTVVSKRKLLKLVQGGFVDGWDDPRMPTLAALRRRGYTPASIREFVNRVGVTKTNARTDVGVLEASVRDDLNHQAPRVMAVLEPIALQIEGLGEENTQAQDAPLWPHDVPLEATRPLQLTSDVWIERGDVAIDPPKGWKRFAPGYAIRLRHGPVVVCDDIEVDEAGTPTAVRGHVVDPERDGVKIMGVVHWVSQAHGCKAEFRLIDRLFADPDPEADEVDITEKVNPDSLKVVHGYVEPFVLEGDADQRWQFERQGYFWRDPAHLQGELPTFLRIVTLKDGWARKSQEEAAPAGKALSKPEAKPAAKRGQQVSTKVPDKVAALDEQGARRFEALEAKGVARDDAVRVAEDADLAAFWERAYGSAPALDASLLTNWALNELPRAMEGRGWNELSLTAEAFAELVSLVSEKQISATVAKELLQELASQGGSPRTLVEDRNLGQLSDQGALHSAVQEVLAAHPDEVATYLGGKEGLIGFFVGQVMRATQGRADATEVRAALTEALNARR